MNRIVIGFAVVCLAGAVGCGPDLVFDHPCDRESPQFQPCQCLGCLGDQCEVSGLQCLCHGSGPDGASGWCGSSCCSPGEVCFQETCCRPRCDGIECGDDGCGGTCGTCSGCGETCEEGHCLFTACRDRQCGDNGCGGTCGLCASGECQDGVCTGPGVQP
ncbi:MAG TPA: hypothetical protein PLQ97_06430 [Myxococcota bacterium]|nr:hypothetical protein [Myxococcota bacterium]HQK50577.1 hypothetical protein [Myxococcota bacterium]